MHLLEWPEHSIFLTIPGSFTNFLIFLEFLSSAVEILDRRVLWNPSCKIFSVRLVAMRNQRSKLDTIQPLHSRGHTSGLTMTIYHCSSSSATRMLQSLLVWESICDINLNGFIKCSSLLGRDEGYLSFVPQLQITSYAKSFPPRDDRSGSFASIDTCTRTPNLHYQGSSNWRTSDSIFRAKACYYWWP